MIEEHRELVPAEAEFGAAEKAQREEHAVGDAVVRVLGRVAVDGHRPVLRRPGPPVDEQRDEVEDEEQRSRLGRRLELGEDVGVDAVDAARGAALEEGADGRRRQARWGGACGRLFCTTGFICMSIM